MRLVLIFCCLLFSSFLGAQNITIKKVAFNGLNRTNEAYLQSILRLEGRLISITDSQAVFNAAKRDLYNTKLFSKVSHSVNEISDGIELTFNITERWYTYATPFFELIDRNFNEWWVVREKALDRIIIGADFTQRNVTGRNDNLAFTFLAGNQNKLNLSYKLPNYWKNGKLGFSADLKYEAFRNVNYGTSNNQLIFAQSDIKQLSRFEIASQIIYAPVFNRQFWFGLKAAKRTIGSEIQQLAPNYFGKELSALPLLNANVGLRIDTRNIRGYAQKGQLFIAQLNYFLFPGHQTLNFPEVNMRYTRHVPFKQKTDLALSSIVKVSTNKARPYYLNRGIGWGVNAMRTYDYFVMDGNNFFVQKASIRYRAYNKTINFKKLPLKQFRKIPFKAVPKLFFDVGYINNQQYGLQGDFLNRPLFGYGMGLDLVVFDDAVWRFEYGWNHTGEAAFFLNFTSAIQ